MRFALHYKIPAIRITIHILFWIAYLLFSVLNVLRFYPNDSLWDMILRFSASLPVDIVATYYTAYLLIPTLLFKKKYLLFGLLFIVGAVLAILLQRVIVWYVTYPLIIKTEITSKFFRIDWLYAFSNIYAVVLFISGVKLIQRNNQNEKISKEIKNQRTEAELKFLKAQVHPHFLLNTLNNLYALTLEKSDKAAEVVIKLSELLNYMLYECNESTILISKEIKLIENYLALEQIRYGKKLNLTFNVEGEIAGKKLAPMFLLPFVENAFKHGVSQLSSKSRVIIQLSMVDHDLHFKVINSMPFGSDKDPGGYTEGIGLKNVKRRLDLMYPENYQLSYASDNQDYIVDLKIKTF